MTLRLVSAERHPMLTATARIRCAESGHMWEDAAFFVQPAGRNSTLKEVWEREQHCMRDGCERTRTDRVEPDTFHRISRVYGGRIERLGRMTREGMLREIIG